MKKIITAAALSLLATAAYGQAIKGTGGQPTGDPVTNDSTTTGGQGTGTGQNSDAVEGGMPSESSMSALPVIPKPQAGTTAGTSQEMSTGSTNNGDPVTDDSMTTGGQGTGTGQNSNLTEGNMPSESSGSAAPSAN